MRLKLSLLTTVKVKPNWPMCINLLCTTTTASIPVRQLFSMDGRPPNKSFGYFVSPDAVND